MLLILLAGMAAELFLPSVTGGTSIERDIAVILPAYSFQQVKRAAEDETDEAVEKPASETLLLLSLADLDAENETAAVESVPVRHPEETIPAEEMPAAELLTEMPEETILEEGDEDGSHTFMQEHARVQEVPVEAYRSYEELVKTFYTIDENTIAGQELLNVDRLLAKDMRLADTEEGDGPQILIYHTHSLEAYEDSAPGNPADSVMGVGEHLAEILREKYGYRVLHCTEQFDVENRNQAYAKALPVLEQILEEYPGIQVMIDLHRDEMPQGTRLVTEVDGKPTARFMFFNGLSRTKKTGDILYLKNENLDGNLAFSFRMQEVCMEYYPGLARKIYLKGYRYNLHLLERALLVEMGAQNNTVEEAMNACEPLAHVLHLVLSGEP